MLLKIKDGSTVESLPVAKTIDGKPQKFVFTKNESVEVPDGYGEQLHQAQKHLLEKVVSEKEKKEIEFHALAESDPEKFWGLVYEAGIPKTVKNIDTAIQKLLEKE